MSQSKMTVMINGAQVEFPKREFDSLYFFANNQGKALTRKQIIDAAWPSEHIVDRTVDIHVMKLRRKIGDIKVKMRDGSYNYKYINTVKGVGYRLSDDLNIKIDDDILKNIENAIVTEDEIIIHGSYKDSKKNIVSVIGVAESKFGKLVVFIGAGTCAAVPIKEFKAVFKPA